MRPRMKMAKEGRQPTMIATEPSMAAHYKSCISADPHLLNCGVRTSMSHVVLTWPPDTLESRETLRMMAVIIVMKPTMKTTPILIFSIIDIFKSQRTRKGIIITARQLARLEAAAIAKALTQNITSQIRCQTEPQTKVLGPCIPREIAPSDRKPCIHRRAAGEVGDAASNEGKDRKDKNRPPDPVVQRQALSGLPEHKQKTPLDGPQRQPEEELDDEELLQHNQDVGLECRIRGLQAGGNGHEPEVDGDNVEIQRRHDDERYQSEIHEDVLQLDGCASELVPSGSGTAEHKDGSDA